MLSLLGAGVSDYQDVLFDPAHAAACRDALRAWIVESDLAACAFSELPPDSPLCALRLDGVHELCEEQDSCVALELPAGVELSSRLSKNLRQNLRLAQKYAARDGLVLVRAEPSELPRELDALFRLHARRREQLGEQSAFTRPGLAPFHLDAACALARARLLALYVLRDREGQTCGVLYGLRDRAALRIYQYGFDPAFARYSPGALLTAYAIERERAEGVLLFDFLRGQEAYKYRWGARDRVTLRRRSLERMHGSSGAVTSHRA